MEQQPRFEEMVVLVGDKKKKRQEGGIVHGKTIRPVIVRFERCIERLYRRTLFQKRLSESQSGKKRDRGKTEIRLFRQLPER